MSVLLVAEKIEKRYRDRVVLRAEWIAVNAGDAIILSGPNGGGKSTLMRILIGVTAPSAGRLERTREMKALRLVYVPQEGGLYQNLTLLENYQLWSRLYGEPASASSNFFSLLEFLGLEPFLRLRVSELSGGYRKIAAILCALSVRPEGIFLDEPLSGVDGEKRQELLQILRRCHTTKGALVISSHTEADLPFANKMIRVSGGVAKCSAP